MPVLIPPVTEQIKISRFLDEKCTLIEQLNAVLQKKKDVLNAFRKSVIYEYVSGKKEVSE